jgi:hypothetical protein
MDPIHSLYRRSTNDTSVSWTGELNSAMTRGPDDLCTMISPGRSAPCFRNTLSHRERIFVSTSGLERLYACAFWIMFCIVNNSLYVGFRTLWKAIKKLKEWHFLMDCLKSWRKMKRMTLKNSNRGRILILFRIFTWLSVSYFPRWGSGKITKNRCWKVSDFGHLVCEWNPQFA